MDKKIYKIGILYQGYPLSYININNEKTGIVIEIWKYIKKKLIINNIKFKEIDIIPKHTDWHITDINYENIVNQTKNKKYDMVVGSFWLNVNRLKSVNFSYPLFIKDDVLIYNNRSTKTYNFKEYIISMLKLWIIPFIIFIVTGLSFAIILNKVNNTDIITNIYFTMAGIFGQTQGLMFDNNEKMIFQKSSFVRILFLFFILLFNLYVSTKIASKSVYYYLNTNDMENNITNKNIMVDNPLSYEQIKKLKGNAILKNKKYLINCMKNNCKNIDGYFPGSVDINKILDYNSNLKISKLKLFNRNSTFILNKNIPYFEKKINKIIIEMSNNNIIRHILSELNIDKKSFFY